MTKSKMSAPHKASHIFSRLNRGTHLAWPRDREIAARDAFPRKTIGVLWKTIDLGVWGGRERGEWSLSGAHLKHGLCSKCLFSALGLPFLGLSTWVVQKTDKELIANLVELKGDKGGKAGNWKVSKAKLGQDSHYGVVVGAVKRKAAGAFVGLGDVLETLDNGGWQCTGRKPCKATLTIAVLAAVAKQTHVVSDLG